MPQSNSRTRLRVHLSQRYVQLRQRLTALLGSPDQASSALNEAWLQLERMPSAHVVLDNEAYLLRMAANIAYRDYRQESKTLSLDDLGELFEYADEQADTERIVAARLAVAGLQQAMLALPPRRRAILLAARLQGDSHKVIAQRHGVSVKTVERELMLAVRSCQAYLQAGTYRGDNEMLKP